VSDVIRWEQPPTEHGNAKPKPPLKYQAAADALRERPGEWALLAEGKAPGTAGGMVWRIKNGVGPFAPARSFEAKCVGPAGGSSSKVYARFVGEQGGVR
jgi:hypothetical protein